MAEPLDRQQAPGAARRVVLVAAVAGCALGLALRWLAAQTDPWLDEVWTFELIRQILFPTDVLFELHHSNNHPLNTLFLYWLGDGGGDFWWYRLHTVAAGVGTIALAVVIAARRGAAEAVFAAVLFSTSFLLVHHSSQARGYALMLFGLFGAFYALQRYHDRPSLAAGAAYAAGLTWALLSNLYALYAMIGLSVWSAAVAVERAGGLRPAFVPLLKLHIAPVCVLALVLVTFYLPGLAGRQFATNHYGIVSQAASLLLGGPFIGPWAGLLLWVAAGLLIAGLFVLRRDPDREWLWYALVVVLAPGLVLWVTEPRALYVRFFVASTTFLLLLVAILAGRLWRAGSLGRLAATAGVAAIVWGNSGHIDHLIGAGRGQYLAAARYMAQESVGSDVVVGSDHVFGTDLVLRFYDPLVPDARFLFVPREDSARSPEWLVRVGHPRPAEVHYAGQLYDRDRVFPGGGFGFDWQLYRRVPMVDAIRRKSGR